MKYRTKEVVDAEQFTEELMLYCLQNNQPTRLGFKVSGSYNKFSGELISAHIAVDNAPVWDCSPGIGDWVVVYSDDNREVFTNSAFLESFEPVEE